MTKTAYNQFFHPALWAVLIILCTPNSKAEATNDEGLMPLPIQWDLISRNCKKQDEGWSICIDRTEQSKSLMGKAANTSGDLRHIFYGIHRKDIQTREYLIKTDLLEQTVFDCKDGQGYKRYIGSRVDLGMGAGWTAPKWSPQEKWSKSSLKDLDFLYSFCPVKAGYKRYGSIQVDTKNVVKNESFVNTRAILGNGEEVIVSIDCKRLLYGVNNSPTKPIPPKSPAEEIFKKTCPAR